MTHTLTGNFYLGPPAVVKKLYAGTGLNGKLYEWNGTNLWVEVAPQLGTESYIFSLAVL